MKNLLLTIFLCLTISTVIHSQRNDSINFFIQNYQYSKALELLETENDISDEILMTKASLYKNLHKYNEAIERYKLVYQSDTTNIKVIVDMSNSYEAINDYETAQILLNYAFAIDTSNIYIIQKLGDSYYQSRKFNQAIDFYLKAEEIDSSYYLARQLARSYESVGNDSTAIVYYNKTLDFNPKDFRSLLRLVNIYRKFKDIDRALVLTENYLKTDSLNTQVLQISGALFYSKNSLPTATKRFQKCLDLKDSSDFVMKYMGYSLFKMMYYDESKEFLEYTCNTASEINNPDPFYMAGLAHTRTSTPEIGIKYLEVALELLTMVDSSFMSRFYVDLGTARYKNYQYRQAIKDFETALIYNPKDYSVFNEIANIYDVNLKNRKKAIEYYKKFLSYLTSNEQKSAENSYSNYFIQYVGNRIQRLEEEEFMEKGK